MQQHSEAGTYHPDHQNISDFVQRYKEPYAIKMPWVHIFSYSVGVSKEFWKTLSETFSTQTKQNLPEVLLLNDCSNLDPCIIYICTY